MLLLFLSLLLWLRKVPNNKKSLIFNRKYSDGGGSYRSYQTTTIDDYRPLSVCSLSMNNGFRQGMVY